MRGQARLRRWSIGGATGPFKLTFAQRSMVRKEKNTLKMKPHRVWKPFQVAPGQSIKTRDGTSQDFLDPTGKFQNHRRLTGQSTCF